MANEIQKYTFSVVPTGGSWTPVYESSPGSAIAWDAAASTALDAILDGLIGPNSDSSGDYISGLTVEFNGSLSNTNVSTLSYQDNTLTVAGDAAFATTQEGGGGSNEVQTIVIDADGGTFTIAVAGYGTTGSLNWNADASTISSAFAAIGLANSATGSWPSFSIEFNGAQADTDIQQMAFGINSLTKAVSISVSVLQEGSAAPPASSSGSLSLMGVG